MRKEEKKYLSYLLRFWRLHINKKKVWRFSLEDPLTGERKAFATIEELYKYLNKEIQDVDPNNNINNQN